MIVSTDTFFVFMLGALQEDVSHTTTLFWMLDVDKLWGTFN